MHPGPINRGVELDSDVADGPHSIILNQVENGVAVRMAALYLLSPKVIDRSHLKAGKQIVFPTVVQVASPVVSLN